MVDPKLIERTPAFVLEYREFQRNLQLIDYLQRQIPARFLLALKGFAMHAVFDEIAKVATGATASSLYEAQLASEYFTEVHTYCPVYIPKDIPALSSIARHMTFNSIAEAKRYIPLISRKSAAGLRINPEYATVETDLYNPCVPGSRLGVRASELPTLPAGISGLHTHNLCESGAEELAGTLEQIERLFGHLLGDIEWLNLGGGHLVTRRGYNHPLFIETLTRFHDRYPHIELILEPGAAFVWETGVLVAEVLDIVKSGPETILMLDTSFAAHMPDCLEMPYTPRIRGGRILQQGERAESGEVRIRLGGNSCLAGDWVGDYALVNLPQVGDRIVFEDMMHYTMVKTTLFNGVALPDIGIYKDGSYRVVTRSSYEQYKFRLS